MNKLQLQAYNTELTTSQLATQQNIKKILSTNSVNFSVIAGYT